MIPKVIHYCWFGNNPKSKLIEDCIKSWEKLCPDFEIIEWNEKNSKPYQNKFFKDALRKKKYAFASDCIRVKILYELGGVYLDTDMLLLMPIEELLNNNFFTGFEVDNRPNFALFGAVPKHHLIKKMVSFYDGTEFNEFSLPVITHTFKEVIAVKNLEEKDKIFDTDYFYPLPYEKKDDDYNSYITKKTYGVHLWNHSWKEDSLIGVSYFISSLRKVIIDYFFYGYSRTYFIRYGRGFARQIYFCLKNKS
jgi:mannosyltransferase OCH1-like enzyme